MRSHTSKNGSQRLMTPEATTSGRLSDLARELKDLREKLKLGGGQGQIEEQHDKDKLTARERVQLLFDDGEHAVEIGMLVGHDLYDGQAPGAGVVTAVGRVQGKEVVVVANDATVKAGQWFPETIAKILRAQEIAMRCRVPIIYLIDSQGINLTHHGGVFPGQYGASRIFYYSSIMRRYLRVPQLAAVMGPCVTGSAYLPALSDVILMVEGTSFMGLGGPNLAKEVTGKSVEAEALGGAKVHTEVSGVAHYIAPDDETCVAHLRQLVEDLPRTSTPLEEMGTPPRRLSYDLYDLLPEDHRTPYEIRDVLECILDGNGLEEFQPGHAEEVVCGTAHLEGISVGVIANARGVFKSAHGSTPHFGGIVYTESARKVAFFVESMNRQGTPLLFIQDVLGFMVGPDAEHSGIIRAGAEFIEAMATATVPKLVLTLNHASGAGYYAMAGQGFDPDFILTLPTGRMGVMEVDAAVTALFGSQLDDLKAEGHVPNDELTTEIEKLRKEYDRQLDARFAAARGFVDEIVLPEEIRSSLGLLLRAALNNKGPHTGPFQIPLDMV